MTEELKGCSKCGSTTIHACPGYPIPPWTEEKKAELARVLAEYEVEPEVIDILADQNLDPESVKVFAGIHASKEFTLEAAHKAFAHIKVDEND